MTRLCSHCHQATAQPTQRYCAQCRAAYMRGWRRKRAGEHRQIVEALELSTLALDAAQHALRKAGARS